MQKLEFNLETAKSSRYSDQEILSQVHGSICKSQIVVVLGDSGCGKTSLLRTIAARPTGLYVVGSLSINGELNDPSHHRKVAFLEQSPALPIQLSVEEIVLFHCAMRSDEPKDKWDDIARASMEHANVIEFRSQTLRTVSGGQYKRVALACELTSHSEYIVLDEPTSGLSGTDALEFMNIMKRVAFSQKKGVLASLHQPRNEIMNLADNIIVMSKGKIILSGALNQIMSYVSANLHAQPAMNQNPADFILDYVVGQMVKTANTKEVSSGDSLGADELTEDASITRVGYEMNRLERSWKRTSQDRSSLGGSAGLALRRPSSTRFKRQNSYDVKAVAKSGIGMRLRILCLRQAAVFFRDRAGVFFRFFGLVSIGFVIGLLFRGVDADIAEKNTTAFLYFLSVFSCVFSLSSVQSMLNMHKIFSSEYAAGLYGTKLYILSEFLGTVIFDFITAVAHNVVAIIICGIDVGMIGIIEIACFNTMAMFCSMAVAQVSSSLTSSGSAAICLAGMIFGVELLFSGYFLSPDSANELWDPIYRLCFIRYAYLGSLRTFYEGEVLESCHPSQGCIFTKGNQVLNFYSIGQETRMECAVALLVIFIYLKAIHWASLKLMSSKKAFAVANQFQDNAKIRFFGCCSKNSVADGLTLRKSSNKSRSTRIPTVLGVVTLIAGAIVIALFFSGNKSTNACKATDFRSIDGSCTSLVKPDAGVVYETVLLQDPTTNSNLPSPRLVSNLLLKRESDYSRLDALNAFHIIFGLVFTHDVLSLTSNYASSQYYDIPIPTCDPEFDSLCLGGQTMKVPQLNPQNQQTAWMDMSIIYGSTQSQLNNVRNVTEGCKLRLVDGYLPISTSGPYPTLDAVDSRVNGNWMLEFGVTLYSREHNYWCDEMRNRHPTWSNDDLFDHARDATQRIAARHFWVYVNGYFACRPGDSCSERMGKVAGVEEISTSSHLRNGSWIEADRIWSVAQPYSEKYSVNFGSKFGATVIGGSYRIHGFLPSFVTVNDSSILRNVNLTESFRNPSMLRDIGFDNIAQGLMEAPLNGHLGKYPNDLRNMNISGMLLDLAAVDVLRSRELMMPNWNDFLSQANIDRHVSFHDLTGEDVFSEIISQLYPTIDNVEYLVGEMFNQRNPHDGFPLSIVEAVQREAIIADVEFLGWNLIALSDRFGRLHGPNGKPNSFFEDKPEWFDEVSVIVDESTTAAMLARHLTNKCIHEAANYVVGSSQAGSIVCF